MVGTMVREFETFANFYAAQMAYEHKSISNPAGTVLVCKLTKTNRKTILTSC